MTAKKTNHNKEYCPISTASKIVGDFWSIMIIRYLFDNGCQRFNQIEEGVTSITSTTLSSRLKTLTEEGIIERKQYESIPPKVEYSLTKKGDSLKEVVKQLEKFAHTYYEKPIK